MIVIQHPYVDDNEISHNDKVKIYSDSGLQIEQKETGRIYDSVVDVYPSNYNYEETENKIEEE